MSCLGQGDRAIWETAGFFSPVELGEKKLLALGGNGKI